MDRQGDVANHLEPVIALLQMGPLMGQDELAVGGRHAHGDIDLGSDKAQNESGFNAVAFPAAGDLNRLPHLIPQA